MSWWAVGSQVLSALGSMSEGNDRAAQYEAYAQANAYNAAVLRARAESARGVAAVREDSYRTSSRIDAGEQRAMAAESGMGMGGSNLDILRQNAVMRELDALNIRYEGEMAAYDFTTEANLQDWESGINMGNASRARSRGMMGMVGNLIGAYGTFKKYGLGSGGSGPSTGGGGRMYMLPGNTGLA